MKFQQQPTLRLSLARECILARSCSTPEADWNFVGPVQFEMLATNGRASGRLYVCLFLTLFLTLPPDCENFHVAIEYELIAPSVD